MYLKRKEDIADIKRVIKATKYELLIKLIDKYKNLSEGEIKELVIEKKWYATLSLRLDEEMQHVNQNLQHQISALSNRYAQTLSEIDEELNLLEDKVKEHLLEMGFDING